MHIHACSDWCVHVFIILKFIKMLFITYIFRLETRSVFSVLHHQVSVRLSYQQILPKQVSP